MLGSMSFIFCSLSFNAISTAKYSISSQKVYSNWPLWDSKYEKLEASVELVQQQDRWRNTRQQLHCVYQCEKGVKRMAEEICHPNLARLLACNRIARKDSCSRKFNSITIIIFPFFY
jgi:predicted nucleotide-binding protein (sugar kinase/HSP70/actin superfamily)